MERISVLAMLIHEEVRMASTVQVTHCLVLYGGERRRSYAKVRGKVILYWGILTVRSDIAWYNELMYLFSSILTDTYFLA
jgi:hypothetical protein